MDNVTAIIVESNTLDLTRHCLNSLQAHYPALPMILVDNASNDGSREMVVDTVKQHRSTAILNEKNVGHGPGMHQALMICETSKALLLDSDCIVLSGYWLEMMLLENAYLVGKQVNIDYGGIIRKRGDPYIHPACALIDVTLYRTLPPFNHHGMPCMLNERDARKRGYRLASFNVDSYVYHLWAGTRRRYANRIDGWVRLERPHPDQARTAHEMLSGNTAKIITPNKGWLP